MKEIKNIQVGTKLVEKYGKNIAVVSKVTRVESRMNGRGGFSAKDVFTLTVNGDIHPRVMDLSSLNSLWRIA